MISIIIPVYNVEKYLAKCIDSVLAQDLEDWELLLINDGSTDSSGNICDEYAVKDARIKVFHQVNKGVSTARNIGIDNAKGEYITFIDSDDYITSTYLSDLAKFDSDIIASGFDLWYADERPTERKTFDELKSYHIQDNTISDAIAIGEYKYLWHGPCCKFYKKTTINDNRFDESLNYGEDHLFNLCVLQNCSSITLVPVSNYIYTHYGNGSLTNRLVNYNLMFDYLYKLKNIRSQLINTLDINNKTYISFCDKQLTFYFWQTIYTLYLTNSNKLSRNEIFSNASNKIGNKIIFFKCDLPRTYRIMQSVFKYIPYVIADYISTLIVK